MIYPGYKKAIITYQCEWCERTEVVEYPSMMRPTQLDGWREDPRTLQLTICSSDCEREQDICCRKSVADCAPGERGSKPPQFDRVFAKKRLEMLRGRGTDGSSLRG